MQLSNNWESRLQHRARHLCRKVLQNAIVAYAVLDAELLLQCAPSVTNNMMYVGGKQSTASI